MDNSPQKTPNPVDKWRLVSLSLELGFIIALPLLAFALLGKWVDNRWNTEPWMTLLGIILAITATTLWLTRRFKEMIK